MAASFRKGIGSYSGSEKSPRSAAVWQAMQFAGDFTVALANWRAETSSWAFRQNGVSEIRRGTTPADRPRRKR